ncbi:MAG TPA: N-acetylmuramoyl-L-alanine amidase [Gaiellaceae bacterium]|nr:N-acetylmuramoyl-L-alanine amidase [Gaiellaceae bacterium]
MRALVLAAVALLAVPAVAHAAGARAVTRELTPGARAVVTRDAPLRFELVGVSSRGPGTVEFRVRGPRGWSAWHPARPEPEDGPDSPGWRGPWKAGSPWWTGHAHAIQYRLHGQVSRLRTTFVSSPVRALPAVRRLTYTGAPGIIPRRVWAGTDTGYRRKVPARYAPAVRFAVVHHTAGASPATPAQSAAMVRAIAVYHVYSNGWDDIGYNFLVDRFGQIFEGRYGGIDRPVIGAHAEGFNTGSVGVALIGTYNSASPSAAARAALVRLLAWRLDLAHVDPLSRVTYASGGNPEYRAGRHVTLRAISGHRDTGFTSCPGDRAYALLPGIAAAVSRTGLPKLYSPLVEGRPGGLVHFTGRFSGPLAWRVDVVDSEGIAVAAGAGFGAAVDWTWNAGAVPAGTYHWTISGPNVRAASGSFTGGIAAPAMTAAAAPPVVSPDGDGYADTGVVTYRLGRALVVTATMIDAFGDVMFTLPQGRQTAGTHSLTWPAAALADGAYSVVLVGTAGAARTTTTVSVSVNRTLAHLAVVPVAISPNGDGVADALAYSYALAVPADVVVTATRRGDVPLTLAAASLPAGVVTAAWTGAGPDGAPVPDGTYTFAVRATNGVGAVTQSTTVVVDTVAPVLQLVSRSPLRIRSSEDATLTFSAAGRTVTARATAGVTRNVSVQGSPLTVVATDAAGNRSEQLVLR